VGGGLTVITFGNHAMLYNLQTISLSTSGQLRSENHGPVKLINMQSLSDS